MRCKTGKNHSNQTYSCPRDQRLGHFHAVFVENNNSLISLSNTCWNVPIYQDCDEQFQLVVSRVAFSLGVKKMKYKKITYSSHTKVVLTEKSFLKLVNPDQIWNVITLFRQVQQHIEFRLLLNLSESCKDNPNFVFFNKIRNRVLLQCVQDQPINAGWQLQLPVFHLLSERLRLSA